MSENPMDRKAARIQVSAEEARKTATARVQDQHQKSELAIERERQKLALQRERRIARQQAKREKRSARRHARTQFLTRINAIAPTAGRRAMITGPIIAPMAVAWIGQIGFAHDKLGWPLLGALVFAAAWELTTAFTGWMYHQARKDGDRGALFRVATWVFACSAGAMNYWHACPVVTERLNLGMVRQHIDLDPNPKAVSYGAMSLVGIALWELYSSLIHRKHLREAGIVSSARPRFGILRWVRFTRITWHAWSLAVRYGIKTVDEAWAAAVTEIDRVDRQRASAAARKRLAKDKRPAVRLVVATTIARPVTGPKTRVRLFWTDGAATTLSATTRTRPSDRPDATTPRPVDATTTVTGRPAIETSGRDHTNDHPSASSDQVDAITPDDHPGNRTRPVKKTTRKTGRNQADATTKPQPSTEDNQLAVDAYLSSVQAGSPLSKRALAKQFGFSPSWALKRIQEAGPRPVGGGRRSDDQADATTPKDQHATSEVKTG
jgi:hypothetical protein